MAKTTKKTARSGALAAVHEMMSDLRDAGLVDDDTMRKFDQACLAAGERKKLSKTHTAKKSAGRKPR